MRFDRAGRARGARQLERAAARAADAFSELLWPTRCVGCEQPGELLCEECRAALPWVEQRLACPVCGAPYGFLTCTECAAGAAAAGAAAAVTAGAAAPWPCRTTVAALGFHGTPARMVTCLKDEHELRLAPVMAAAMATALEEAAFWPAADGAPRFDPAATDAVTFVPATAAAYARRGFDHMELVAAALAALLGLPLADVLVRPSARDQQALGKGERAANLRGTMRVTEDLSGVRLLVVDDVATTGASLGEAARVLEAEGAQVPTTCVLARVW